MALISCRECKQQVSDAATTCPRCGIDGPGGTGVLVVTRKTQFHAGIRGIVVTVDGATRGKLMPGQSISVDVTPGRHDLTVENFKGMTTESVHIRPGETTSCTVWISNINNDVKVQVG